MGRYMFTVHSLNASSPLVHSDDLPSLYELMRAMASLWESRRDVQAITITERATGEVIALAERG